MSLMKEIIEELKDGIKKELKKEIIDELSKGQKIPAKYRWMDSKSGWDNLENKDANSIANEIWNKLKEFEDKGIFNEKRRGFDFRTNDNFSLVKRGDNIEPWRKEESLERFIVAYKDKNKNNNSLRNQINVGNGKESIDLGMIDKDNNLTDIIELKHDTGNDTPLYAVIEILKYYFLLTKENRVKLKKIIILAPKDYYKKFGWNFKGEKNKNFLKFEEIVENLNKNFKKMIIIKRINLDTNKLVEVCSNCVKNEDHEKLWENNKSKAKKQRYSKKRIAPFKAKDIYNKELQSIVFDNLYYKNWQNSI